MSFILNCGGWLKRNASATAVAGGNFFLCVHTTSWMHWGHFFKCWHICPLEDELITVGGKRSTSLWPPCIPFFWRRYLKNVEGMSKDFLRILTLILRSWNPPKKVLAIIQYHSLATHLVHVGIQPQVIIKFKKEKTNIVLFFYFICTQKQSELTNVKCSSLCCQNKIHKTSLRFICLEIFKSFLLFILAKKRGDKILSLQP